MANAMTKLYAFGAQNNIFKNGKTKTPQIMVNVARKSKTYEHVLNFPLEICVQIHLNWNGFGREKFFEIYISTNRTFNGMSIDTESVVVWLELITILQVNSKY